MTKLNFFLGTLTLPTTEAKPQCQARIHKSETRYGSKTDCYLVSGRCKYPPLDNGYCTVHQLNAEVMKWGASIGYPLLWVNPHLYIESGRACWQAFAELYTGGRRRMQLIEAIQHYRDGVAVWHV